MITKKHHGRAFGATLSKSEKKAMEIEINRQIAESDRKHKNELEALILWGLHCQFGFGAKRLKRFYDSFATNIEDLIQHYEMDTEKDGAWLCSVKLKDIGVDVEKWGLEVGEQDVS